MTPQEWNDEVRRRIAINEGCRLTMYHDTVGVPTIAYGFNLESSTAAATLAKCGVSNPSAVIAGLESITQAQADATFALMLPGYVAAGAARWARACSTSSATRAASSSST